MLITKKAVKELEKVIKDEGALLRDALKSDVTVKNIDGIDYIANILTEIEARLVSCIRYKVGLPELLEDVRAYKKEAETDA